VGDVDVARGDEQGTTERVLTLLGLLQRVLPTRLRHEVRALSGLAGHPSGKVIGYAS
jgi:hypothetical protein